MKEKHPRKASITLQWLKTMYRWAWKRDIVDVPIMDAVEIETEQGSRDRWFTDDEIKAVWKGVEELGPLNANYVRLLILLATRKSELAGMRRSELDDPKKPTVWTIPHERTKTRKSARKKRVYIEPLTPLAARIISSLPELEDDLVFPGRHKGKPIVPGNWLQTRVQKLSGIDDWNFHACRHTVATWLQNEGISEWERGLVLNHAEGSVTAGYSHGFATDRKRELLEMWENHVKSLVAPDGVESLYG